MTFNKTTLPNGLRIITVPMADNPSVTVLVMVETGSKYETKDIGGISHFLEHMVFKGTPRRPSAIDISRELDGLGAHYNAFTSQEFTGYYAKAASRHLDTILDIVSDMYLNPLLEQAEIEKEKGVIIEELRMYRDLPQRHVHDVFMDCVYGDQPVGWDIIGTEESIRSFARPAILQYRTDHYTAPATTVIISGSFNEAETIQKASKIFGTLPASAPKGKLSVSDVQDGPRFKALFKETDQTHLVIGVRTFPVLDPRIPAMSVLSTILGRGMSSRLWSKMRDDLGICYYIRAEHDPYTDHGLLSISAGVDNARVPEAVKGILAECARLRDELVGKDELAKAKENIAGSTMLELETSDARAEFAGFQEALKGRIDNPADMIAKVNAVTAEEVRSLAKEVFSKKGLNMAVIGRFSPDDSFKGYFTL